MHQVMEQTDRVNFIDWYEFLDTFQWKQGEHVTILGPTGQGKTFLSRAILPRRDYVISLVTKRKDERIREFKQDGFTHRKEWTPNPPELEPKILLHPEFKKDEPREREQIREFSYALNRAFDEGNWTVHVPEISYIVEDLRLERLVKRLWQQGRSLKASVIAEAQRPAWVPLAAYSMATHLFFFHNNDEVDTKRMGGLGGVDRKLVAREISLLDSHEVLYLNTRTRELMRTKVRKEG